MTNEEKYTALVVALRAIKREARQENKPNPDKVFKIAHSALAKVGEIK